MHPSGRAFAFGAFLLLAPPLETRQEYTEEIVDVGLTDGHLSDPEFLYGPTVSVGYQYTSRHGFTGQLGTGVGFSDDGAFFVFEVGAGYTFGRRGHGRRLSTDLLDDRQVRED